MSLGAAASSWSRLFPWSTSPCGSIVDGVVEVLRKFLRGHRSQRDYQASERSREVSIAKNLHKDFYPSNNVKVDLVTHCRATSAEHVVVGPRQDWSGRMVEWLCGRGFA